MSDGGALRLTVVKAGFVDDKRVGAQCEALDVFRDGKLIVTRSAMPFQDACKALLRDGESVRTFVEFYYPEAQYAVVSGQIGVLAGIEGARS